jgi:hypothetical protein
MGRIQLEWDIESRQIEKSDSEDPKTKWARRRNLLRLFLLICIMLGMAVVALLFAENRLREVDKQLDQLLRDTVNVEVSSLRIGDFDTFMNLQRSATDEWLNTQQASYRNYESLKVSSDLKLTGNVLDSEVEEQRGRAIVEEIIDGVPYARVWFYWRYSDGWRHVPPDYTFWGEALSKESESLLIRYSAVDERFADSVNDKITQWLNRGCEILQCVEIPHLTIDILTDSPQSAMWLNEGSSQLLLQSPYVGGARADLPFDVPRQIEVATLIAERLVSNKTNNMIMTYPYDVYQLRQSVISYLVEQFVQVETNSFLIESVATQYGADKVGQFVSLFTPTSDMTMIQQVIPAPIGQANLDWRDFITWRLATEADLIARRLENEWLNLYDMMDESVRVAAYNRYNANVPSEQQVAIEQQMQTGLNGQPQLRIVVRVGENNTFRDEVLLFNLVNNIWKRAS